jgi:hypothetical protein
MTRPKTRSPLTRLVFVCLAAFSNAGAADHPEVTPSAGVAIDLPLIAHWTFDEPSGNVCADASGHGWQAELASGPAALGRRRGLFGNALSLSDRHLLRVSPQIPVAHPAGISFSAWVRPTDLSSYREIFRKEDGNDRVLFSFQNDGTILSLGLNIDGYVECDAKITPAQVTDGRWHHCAATFDGQWMRVYLDGDLIGTLQRPGTVRAGGAAAGCIGSSNGGECFQGTLDDLRIYAGALSEVQIAQLYRQGLELIEQSSAELVRNIRAVYQRGEAFADTLMQCRQRIVQQQLVLDPELAAAVAVRLKTDFPADYGRFVDTTGISLKEFLAAGEADAHVRQARRLVDLLLEYMPLTDQQWQRQTPQQRQQWQAAAHVREQFEQLQTRSTPFSGDWISFLVQVAPQNQQRPVQAEAVAPYVPPATPLTRDLSADEARAALQRDWLFQADGRPTAQRIGQEIGWTRELAARIRDAAGDTVDFADVLAELDTLQQQAESLTAADPELYFRVRRLKRQIMFRNPVVDFQKILLVDMPYPQGKEWQHETRHRLGYMAVPGGRLAILEGLSPAGHLTQLMPQTPLHGSFWRPDVSFDGQRVLFCFKPHNEKSFHLYEINTDGTDLVQLTDGPFDDFDPIYLPDGHILFSTTRGHTYVRCMPPTNAYVLARCDADGRNIYLVSRNNEPDYLPSVMNDGRVIYTRWEYTDKPLWRAQGLWTVNPDGTQVQTFWGNQSVWPDLLKDARSIPGSRRVMFTGSAHHNWFSGSVGILDPDHGFNFPHGLTKVTAEVAYPESGNGPVDPIESPRYHASGAYSAYYSPYPLGEQDFLVSANREGKFLLYLMDTDGNRELIYEGVHNIFHAQPLRLRARPPVIADQVAWPSRQQRDNPGPGVIYSGNVYFGAPPELVDRARFLRVLNIEHKTYTYWHKRPYLSTGPVVSAVQSEGVKRIFGTVPIEPDGSVAFYAPSGVPLHFQLLDDQHRALQTMRSFTGVLPGERRGCLGCHESHSRTPAYENVGMALYQLPREIEPPPWGEASIGFPRFVQPVLDQYCGRCHQGDGEGRKTVDLTDRPGFLIFSEPYLLLTGRPSWGRPYEKPENPPPGFGIANMLHVEGYDQRDPLAYRTPPPMTALSYSSKLIEIASSGQHHDVQVDPISLQKLIAWVDTMAPYRGAEEVRELDDPEFQGVDWLAIRPRIKTAPKIVRPGPVD